MKSSHISPGSRATCHFSSLNKETSWCTFFLRPVKTNASLRLKHIWNNSKTTRGGRERVTITWQCTFAKPERGQQGFYTLGDITKGRLFPCVFPCIFLYEHRRTLNRKQKCSGQVTMRMSPPTSKTFRHVTLVNS